jgi:hypothetical protein
MFPVEKPLMLNTMIRGTMRQRIPEGSISMMNLLDEKILDKIAEYARTPLERLGYIQISHRVVLAIFINAQFIKPIIIHRYALHSTYGCGIHVLVAIWSSASHLLLHLDKPIKARQRNQHEEQQQFEILPMTEEPQPKSPSTSEDHHPVHKVLNNINIVNKVKSYNELHKPLKS